MNRENRAATMLTPQEVEDAQAMRARGWTISVIARHLRRDRKTIRSYLTGQRPTSATRRAGPDQLEPFIDYCRRRFTDDPHLPVSTLFEDLVELGYQGAYSTLTKGIRRHDLRPHCGICRPGPTPTP
ncbi:hypothetical protein [Kitasatospora sp. LaBMicrA B282]|uniref:hypothetical protein n=1 Tax=Kitasatospora sp. LaBMicrA B282 TaxID=3420949 RepID=UPI003D103CEC